MAYGYTNNKKELIKRLSRAEGQIRGISRMVESDEYCIDILTQISAVRSAMEKVAVELLREHAANCLSNETIKVKGTLSKADELAKAVSRML